MGSLQITRLPSASGRPPTSPDSYPPALTGWPGSGRSWPSLRRAWSSATSTRTGMWWRWYWLNPVARCTALERSSPAMATCPWSLSTLVCGDAVSAASCYRDFTSGPRKEAGAARRCGPGRRTRVLDACTNARGIEGQAMRRPLAAVITSSSSSVKHSDQRRSVEDRHTTPNMAQVGAVIVRLSRTHYHERRARLVPVARHEAYRSSCPPGPTWMLEVNAAERTRGLDLGRSVTHHEG
jgi:hypothetical protein